MLGRARRGARPVVVVEEDSVSFFSSMI
jgi:hypothetical protein